MKNQFQYKKHSLLHFGINDTKFGFSINNFYLIFFNKNLKKSEDCKIKVGLKNIK